MGMYSNIMWMPTVAEDKIEVLFDLCDRAFKLGRTEYQELDKLKSELNDFGVPKGSEDAVLDYLAAVQEITDGGDIIMTDTDQKWSEHYNFAKFLEHFVVKEGIDNLTFCIEDGTKWMFIYIEGKMFQMVELLDKHIDGIFNCRNIMSNLQYYKGYKPNDIPSDEVRAFQEGIKFLSGTARFII